ncbi:MAG: hypothetical protein J5871_04950 [Bacteroidales bacterium]|nr:hypothetical protein [Bacteroidales bacterium]
MKKLLITLVLLFPALMLGAQDLIVPVQGDPISGYVIEEGENYYFYTKEKRDDAPILKIAKDKVLLIRYDNVNTLSAASFADIAEEDIHGMIIARGNCVYIPCDSSLEYEKAGQETVKEIISRWGLWTVVDKPEQAHFVLQYTTQTRGKDYSWIIVRRRAAYLANPVLTGSWDGTMDTFNCKKGDLGMVFAYARSSEEISANLQAANSLTNEFKGKVQEAMEAPLECLPALNADVDISKEKLPLDDFYYGSFVRKKIEKSKKK